jgi:hypothetical protein
LSLKRSISMGEPKPESLDKMWKFVKGFAEKSGTTMPRIPR